MGGLSLVRNQQITREALDVLIEADSAHRATLVEAPVAVVGCPRAEMLPVGDDRAGPCSLWSDGAQRR